MNDYMNISENIISWYPFKKNCKVLLISIDDAKNFNYFFENNNIDFTKCRVKNNDIFEQLNNQNFNGKFDYILLLGSYEHSPLFFNSSDSYSDLLIFLKNLLEQDGKIILSIDNKFGVKYFAGDKSKHYDKIFGSFLSNINYQKSNLMSKQEILTTIMKAGFENYKFYYPLPNYNNPNAIFTDSFLPDGTNSKMLYKLYYDEDSIVLYNEIELMKQLCKDNLFSNFCNSYLVELSLENNINDIKFVSYNNLRKDKYNLRLIIDNDVAIKTPVTDLAKIHIENVRNYIAKLNELGFNILDYVENDILKSKFVKFEELDKILVKLISQNHIEEAFNNIEKWYEYLKERLSKNITTNFMENNIFKEFELDINQENMSQMNFVENGFIDLSFENTFVDDNQEYIFYDQEWYFKNIPIEFILYRALNNLYNYNENEIKSKINLDDLINRFNLLKFKKDFQKIESLIQNQILDKDKIEENNNIVEIHSIECLFNENNDLTLDNIAWREKYKKLEENYLDLNTKYNELADKYAAIVDSRSYKIMKRLKGDKND